MLKIYTCNNHVGYYESGVSVIIAHNEKEARELLDKLLKENGLGNCYGKWDQIPIFEEVSIDKAHAKLLYNGDWAH